MIEKSEIQRRVFSINAVLLLVAALAMAAVLPKLIQETSPDGLPKAAPIATSVGMLIHLLLFLAFLYGVRQAKRNATSIRRSILLQQ